MDGGEGKSPPEAVLRKVSHEEKKKKNPARSKKKRKLEGGRTGHNALGPAGLLRSITSSSSSVDWNVRNPTGPGFWRRGPNLTWGFFTLFLISRLVGGSNSAGAVAAEKEQRTEMRS